jgi:threonine/homoserine efflux transporter RhtA
VLLSLETAVAALAEAVFLTERLDALQWLVITAFVAVSVGAAFRARRLFGEPNQS